MSKKQPVRILRIHKKDNAYIDLPLSKATSVDTKKSKIYLDKLEDGTWRLIWDKNLIEEFSDFLNMEMLRFN